MNDRDKDSLRRDRGAIAQALMDCGGIKWRGDNVCCPFHEDAHASAKIERDEQGIWRFRCYVPSCHVAGDVFDMLARAKGKRPEDVLKELTPCEPARPRAAASEPQRKAPRLFTLAELEGFRNLQNCYKYTHPQTKALEMVVLRLWDEASKKKTFLQARPEGNGFVLEGPPKPWPIYNRSRVLRAHTVIVVEGEKCVHYLQQFLPEGYAATTSPGGSGNAEHADWRPLGGKTVYIWPDADPPDPKTGEVPGRIYGETVKRKANALDTAPQKLFWIDAWNLDLPEKGDCVEFLEPYKGHEWAAIQQVLDSAEGGGIDDEVIQFFKDVIAGKIRSVEWPWPILTYFTQALMPGTVTALCGDPGSTKSYLLLQSGWFWWCNDEKPAFFELEDKKRWHVIRALSQFVGNGDLTQLDWINRNPASLQIVQANRSFMAGFGACIDAAEDRQVRLPELVEWIERKCKAGARIIGIDPITAAAVSQSPWIDDLEFLMKAKAVVNRYGASLILVTHPRKGAGRQKSSMLDDLAGGSAFPRFSHSVFWLEKYANTEQVRVETLDGAIEHRPVNRALQIRKARNGKGAGMAIGYHFDGSLRFTEHGVLLDEDDHEGTGLMQQARPPVPPF